MAVLKASNLAGSSAVHLVACWEVKSAVMTVVTLAAMMVVHSVD